MSELNQNLFNQQFKQLKHVIGLSIRAYRSEKKWTQEYLSYKSGLDRTYIGGIERGERNATLSSILIISLALEISIFDIIARAREEF